MPLPRGAAGGAFLAHQVPGLERAAQLDLHAARGEFPDAREAELEVRREPGRLDGIARLARFLDHVDEVLPDELRQQKAVLQPGAPAREARRAVGPLPAAGEQPTP